jgi:hypothetical protein
MAGVGEGSFDRQQELVLQEVAYSEDEAAGNSTGGGGIVGGYKPSKVGNLHERFASALGLAVEVVEEGGFCGVGEEVGICPGFDALFFGINIREFAFGHDVLEDAVGAIATNRVLFQIGCVDVERAARP